MISINNVKIYQTREILKELDSSLVNNKPFSLIRFGDGGIKLLHSVFYEDDDQLISIIEREGLPKNSLIEFLDWWGLAARTANFIDTPEVYFSNYFWGKYKKGDTPISDKTIDRMLMWKDLYSRAEFDNDKFCNPEVNYLMCIKGISRRNIIDIMKNRRVCIICACPEVERVFKKRKFDVYIHEIVGHFENQYKNSFDSTIQFISENAMNFDMFLIAAGELGRIYTSTIKEYGGVALDIGFVVDYWNEGVIPERMKNFVQPYCRDSMSLELTSFGRLYRTKL